MRHGSNTNDYFKNLTYEKFMSYMQNRENSPLIEAHNNFGYLFDSIKNVFSRSKKQNDITCDSELRRFKIKYIPTNIDIIYCSPYRRAKQSTKKVKEKLENKPKIDESLKKCLAEVKFSEDIISKEQYEKLGGLKGCRQIILEKWFRGENKESLEDSLNRLKKLDKSLRTCPYKNILLITHAWYLRLIYLVYEGKEISLENLQQAPIIGYGEYLEYIIDLNEELKIEIKSDENYQKEYYPDHSKKELFSCND